MSRVFIAGGTKGLGLEVAKLFHDSQKEVIISGRTDPKEDFAEYKELDLSGAGIAKRIGTFVSQLPPIKTLVYNPGFYQEGLVTEVEDDEIEKMTDIGLRGLFYLSKHILLKQDRLEGLITVTSISQWTPREKEPFYSAVKSGEAAFSRSLSLDRRIGKVLIAAPSGMDTAFWDESSGVDRTKFLKPKWVAKQIVGNFEKQSDELDEIHILREPKRVLRPSWGRVPYEDVPLLD